MTTFTQHTLNRIEEYRDIDRRRAVYPPRSRKLPGACDRSERLDYYPYTPRVGHVAEPSFHTDIRDARVRDIMPIIEDMHYDPLFDGWSDTPYGLAKKVSQSLLTQPRKFA